MHRAPPDTTPVWRIGENVPWTVAWTGEERFNLAPSAHFPGLTDLVQAQCPGVGTPKFAAMHVTRHRMGMADHVCHVCGKPTLKRDRYIFPVQSGGFVIMPDESERYAGNVPPVHLRCAKRAQKLCPHLSHTYADPVPYPAEESRLMQRTDVIPGMEDIAKKPPQEPENRFHLLPPLRSPLYRRGPKTSGLMPDGIGRLYLIANIGHGCRYPRIG